MTFMIGFTGTQNGMTQKQVFEVIDYLSDALKAHRDVEVIHGDCIGADFQFDQMAIELGIGRNICPSFISEKRNYSEKTGALVACNPTHPLVRNEFIVAQASVMLATPKEDSEVLRSGTWATIRHARKTLAPDKLIIFYPK